MRGCPCNKFYQHLSYNKKIYVHVFVIAAAALLVSDFLKTNISQVSEAKNFRCSGLFNKKFSQANGAITSKVKHAINLAIKLKTIAATTSRCNNTRNTCTTVVQVLQDLFYVLLQLLVVVAIILSFKFYCEFYCMFHFTCDRSLTDQYGSYAFSCSPFTIHIRHFLPTSNINTLVY